MYELAQNPWSLFGWLWGILGIGIPIAAATWVMLIYISLVNDGKKLQANLSAAYLDAQNHLSHSIMIISEILQVNKKESGTLESALIGAITSRYAGSAGRSSLYSFLQENYPDLHSFNASFGRVDAAISSSRAAFTQMQSNLLTELKTFEQWRTGTFMARLLVSKKFPDSDLTARIGGTRYFGKEALEMMYQIIHTADTLTAYNKGLYAPPDLY